MPGRVNKLARGRQRGAASADEGAVIALRDKADLDAVGLVVDAEPGLPSDLAHFYLAVAADRKEQARQDVSPDAVQDVRLVFVRIGASAQLRAAGAGDDLGVMAGGDVVGFELFAIRPEFAELEPVIADDARVG